MKVVRWWLAMGAVLGALVRPPSAAAAIAEEKEKPEGAALTASAGRDGFRIQSEGGDFKLKITGYAQLDGRFYPGDEVNAAVDTFVLRRVRTIVEGTVARFIDFNITPDFGDGRTLLQDAYLDTRYVPWLRLRVGKFKTLVGLERLQSGSALIFVERAFPTSLAPNRDLGAEIHGEIGEGVAIYAVGVFNGVVDGGSADGDTNDGKDVAARLFFRPFRKGGTEALKALGVGIAGTSGKQEGALPSFRTPGRQTFFSYATGVAAAGSRTRLEPQASYQNGPFPLLGEYIRSRQSVAKGAVRLDVAHAAWQVAAAVILTGEKPVSDVVTPRRPFEPGKGGWGALQLAVRFTALEVAAAAFAGGFADPTRSARKAEAWAVGLNWYLNKNLKQVVNFERTTFTGGRAGGDRPAENAILFRSQIAF